MAKKFDGIDDALAEWIRAQKMFFVASAPLAASGHVNLSPKGLDSLAILGPREVAYLDFVGSGAETIAHARENGRITLMLCAFEGPPRIARLQGRAGVVEPGDADFAGLAAKFPPREGVRAVIRIALSRIADSCGYGVPLMRFEADRKQLDAWVDRKGADGLREYQLANNTRSLDGLPALRAETLRS
ncbi:MAG: pyridoxamine 5'-phosphate oxidase family protein [Deltaproteobacteria bacterium]|nr:pyridoxamine 5'-phosphate oxidase family protein [Deltaproteobacteria bacterium]